MQWFLLPKVDGHRELVPNMCCLSGHWPRQRRYLSQCLCTWLLALVRGRAFEATKGHCGKEPKLLWTSLLPSGSDGTLQRNLYRCKKKEPCAPHVLGTICDLALACQPMTNRRSLHGGTRPVRNNYRLRG